MGQWRYFVIRSRSDGRLVHSLSYRDAENPKGEVDPSDPDRDWYRELGKRFPQSQFIWNVIAMPAGTFPLTYPKEFKEALKNPIYSESWPSNDEY